MTDCEKTVVTVLIVLGGLMQAGGVALVFREIRSIVAAAMNSERSKRAGVGLSARDDLALLQHDIDGPRRPATSSTARTVARVERLVERLASPEGQRDRKIAAWLILGGVALATLGGFLSVVLA